MVGPTPVSSSTAICVYSFVYGKIFCGSPPNPHLDRRRTSEQMESVGAEDPPPGAQDTRALGPEHQSLRAEHSPRFQCTGCRAKRQKSQNTPLQAVKLTPLQAPPHIKASNPVPPEPPQEHAQRPRTPPRTPGQTPNSRRRPAEPPPNSHRTSDV